MPVVPGYKPPGKIEPNYELLAKERRLKAMRDRRLKQPKIDKMREEYRLNNPHYWLDKQEHADQQVWDNDLEWLQVENRHIRLNI